MSNKICVYTCITGNYDNLHEIEHLEKNIDYFCFTNNPKITSKTWKIIQIEDKKLDNCRIARKIKTIGHPIINKYEIAVWTDADVIWQTNISDFIKTYLKNNSSLAIFRHHERTTIHDEAIECLKLRKDKKESIEKTLDFLKSENYPDDNGLCESTVFIKKPNDQKIIDTMQIWFNIISKYSLRDQLSFNYSAWKTDLNFNYIDLNVWGNDWFYTVKHNYHQEINSCHAYYGDSSENFSFNKYFIYPYKKQNDRFSFTATIPCNTEKIELKLTDIIGVSYCDLKITPTPNNIKFQNIYINNQNNITISQYNVVYIYGKFKKNQKISLSVKIAPSNLETVSDYIQHQSSEYSSLLKDCQKLQWWYSKIQTELNNVLNSKGWKTLETVRKIIHPFN